MLRNPQPIADGNAYQGCAHLRLIFLQSTHDTNQPAKCTKLKVPHSPPKEILMEINWFTKQMQNKNQVARS